MALIQRRASAPRREPRSVDFEVAEDRWKAVADDAPLPAGDVIVSFARFRAEQQSLAPREGRLGVRVPNDTRPEDLAPVVARAALIVLDMPSQRDGRAYSLARWLRSRFAYTGELRIVGGVVRDQLSFLARVGFDSFEYARGSTDDALAAFDEFTVHYQSSSDHPLPLWKRAARA